MKLTNLQPGNAGHPGSPGKFMILIMEMKFKSKPC
jgi:hypothetical protein